MFNWNVLSLNVWPLCVFYLSLISFADTSVSQKCQNIFLCPRDQWSGSILFLSCLSFCNSVLLSETLTLLITFKQRVLELLYFTWGILVYTHVIPFGVPFEKLSVIALNIYKYKGSLLTEKYLTEELCNYQFWRKICEMTLEILFMRRHIPLSYFPIYSEYVHLFNYSSFVSQTLSD